MALSDGHFLEEEITLSEEMGFVFAKKQLENGNVRAINHLGILYDSIDAGMNWEPSESQFSFFQNNEEMILLAATLNLDGSAFIALERGHLFVDSNGIET